MRGLIIGVVVIALLGLGAFLWVNRDSDQSTDSESTSSTNPTQDSSTSNSETSPPASVEAADSVTITYSSSGFSPSVTTVKSGGSVTVKNDSGRNLQFDSDPHPAHTENTELNIEFVTNGQSKTFTVTRGGTWGYHNHVRAVDTGTLVVQ